ncbi:MAG: lamin tail domain-containing protein [Nitrosarchaeum sp.]|nr:lamin tail domain-containing protein [Nitrosarchaeum sp.]
MIRILSILFSVLLLWAFVIPASAQSSNHVVINEVDINPPGDDSTSIVEWIELYNPTDSKIDLGGWKIASTTALKKTMTIPAGTFIDSGKFLTYSYQPLWFADSNESIELRNTTGMVVDKTPLLSDLKNDFSSWQRLYDGYDADSITDWKYAISNAGSSNGKQVISEENTGVSVTISTDKLSYLFGQTAIISGSVSKELVITKPYFQPEKIILSITGPNYKKMIELYPDMNLNFKTSLNLQKVLGINEGTYDLSVTYGVATSSTSFSVGDKIIVEDVLETGTISITTDKSEYLPGQTLTLTGMTSEIIPFEGLKFTVKDPNGKIVSNGSLYPTNGKFITTVFLSTVNPVYGTYEIIGEYFDKSAMTTFMVVEDLKEDKPISLWTDKPAYGLGSTVQITGRLNNVWVNSLDLQILQTKNMVISSDGDSGFKILDLVRIQGDGTFSYSFQIPQNNLRLGDYRITVSKDLGSASITVPVVSNPDEFVVTDDLLSLTTSKSVYDLGETLTVSGFIKNPSSRSSFQTDIVNISILNEDGTPLKLIGLSDVFKQGGASESYQFTSIPDKSGSFSFKTTLAKNVFHEGTFLLKAKYLDLQKTIPITIVDPLKLNDRSSITLNKQIFGLGEVVTVNGILPPTGDRSVSVSLTKPDGSVLNSGATVDNQRFTWTWTTPITEKQLAIKSDDRSISKTNYGIYKIRVSTASYGTDVFFKVSATPENDSLSLTPVYVTTEKPLYHAGEKLKVLGNVISRPQGSEGLVVPERVTIKILDGKFPFKQIHESQIYPNQGGEFQSIFELPVTIFSEGEYIVNALYLNKKAVSSFSVTNDFRFGSSEPVSLLLDTDKSQYYPGDVVVLSGKPSKLIYLEKFDVSVIKKSSDEITCGAFFCGKHVGKVTTIRPSPSGSFTHEVPILDSTTSIGTYEITVDAGFETKSIRFDVIEKPADERLPPTIIEKQNRITESQISIMTQRQNIDNYDVAPRVISGSLLTNVADQTNVNLRVTSESGICVIGPELECLVNESTRKPGQIYDIVDVDGIALKIRYSGSDVRLEKFDILPESSDGFLPDSLWNVDVVKDGDQVSRFYYKVNYKTLE